jgi:hypothetical protein
MRNRNIVHLQKSILTLLAVFNIVACGQDFQLKNAHQQQSFLQYSKNLAADVAAVKKSETPQNDTLLTTLRVESEDATSSDTVAEKEPGVDTCGTIQGLIESSNGDVTDEAILTFHKCKISVILEFLKALDKTKLPEEMASGIDAQIAHHEALLEKLDSDKATQDALISGTRKLIEDIKSGKLSQMIEDARHSQPDAPILTQEQKCEILKKSLASDSRITLPEELRPLLQQEYDSKCAAQ